MQVIMGKDILNPDTIKEGLNTKIMGRDVRCFWEIDSTQTMAQELAAQGVEEGTVVLAEKQNEGKGQMGRSWFSPSGKGIWISIILYPFISPSLAGRISLASALSVTEAIREVTGLPALIKWPNDILIDGKKVGGILIEMTAGSNLIKSAVIGIGINVNQDAFPEWLGEKVLSLKQRRGEEIPRLPLLQEILSKLDSYYLALKTGNFEMIAYRWRNLSVTLGKQIQVTSRGKTLKGQAIDIDCGGALLLRLDSGFIRRCISGEVSVISQQEKAQSL